MRRVGLLAVAALCLGAAGALDPGKAAAEARYVVGRDSGGVYLQTERDGAWTIPPEDRHLFPIGEKGTYTRGEDGAGRYILVGGKVKLYLDGTAAGRTAGVAARESGDRLPAGETRVVVKGNRVLVPVRIGHGGREIEVWLLLDTGASITTIDRAALKELPIASSGKAKLLVPGGETIEAEIVRLGHVKVGPHERRGVEAAVIDHRGPPLDYQGLLGMDFLKDVDYRLDMKRRLIRWP